MTDPELAALRQTYAQRTLRKPDVLPAPVPQFRRWLDEAVAAQLPEPSACTLATADPATGQPSARVLLLKGLPDDAAFLFYTSYASRKGRELAAQPLAALNFFWPGLERQVRVEGRVEPAPAEASTRYFQSRPRGSQIGAWASPQSQPVAGRAALETLERETEARFAGLDPLPRPPHWGGYVLRPHRVEFWQGRPSRLHDRLVYELRADADPNWRIFRLAP